jgi:hypothetical protein
MADQEHPLVQLARIARLGVMRNWRYAGRVPDGARQFSRAARASGASPTCAEVWLPFGFSHNPVGVAHSVGPSTRIATDGSLVSRMSSIRMLAMRAAAESVAAEGAQEAAAAAEGAEGAQEAQEAPGAAVAALAAIATACRHESVHVMRAPVEVMTRPIPERFGIQYCWLSPADELISCLPDDIAAGVDRLLAGHADDADGELFTRAYELSRAVWYGKIRPSQLEPGVGQLVTAAADWIEAHAGEISTDAVVAFTCGSGACTWIDPEAPLAEPGWAPPGWFTEAGDRLRAAVCAAHAAARAAERGGAREPILRLPPVII